jgi:hypothetical protein
VRRGPNSPLAGWGTEGFADADRAEEDNDGRFSATASPTHFFREMDANIACLSASDKHKDDRNLDGARFWQRGSGKAEAGHMQRHLLQQYDRTIARTQGRMPTQTEGAPTQGPRPPRAELGHVANGRGRKDRASIWITRESGWGWSASVCHERKGAVGRGGQEMSVPILKGIGQDVGCRCVNGSLDVEACMCAECMPDREARARMGRDQGMRKDTEHVRESHSGPSPRSHGEGKGIRGIRATTCLDGKSDDRLQAMLTVKDKPGVERSWPSARGPLYVASLRMQNASLLGRHLSDHRTPRNEGPERGEVCREGQDCGNGADSEGLFLTETPILGLGCPDDAEVSVVGAERKCARQTLSARQAARKRERVREARTSG